MNVVENILALLRQVELSETETAELATLYGQLEDGDLSTLESGLSDLFDEVRTGAEEMTPEVVTQLERIADVVDGARSVAGERIAASEAAEAEAVAEAAERDARLAELEGRVHVPDPEPDPPAAEDPPAADPPAEAELEPEPVAAGGTPAPAVTPRGDIERARSQRLQVRERPGAVIRAAFGGNFADVGAVNRALYEAHRDLDGTDFKGNRRVATFQSTLPTDRVLPEGRVTDVSDQAAEVRARMRERGGAASLTADGGICGPVEFYYGLQTLGQAGRTLRAALASFTATRGGLRFNSPMVLTDILAADTPTSGNAIGAITEAQDAAGTYDKTFQTVTCADDVEVLVDIVYKQLQFGVLQSRTNPERNAQFTELTDTMFARYSEQRLFNKMLALAHKQHTVQNLGASRDLLTILNRWAINRRAQHRMDPNAQLDVIIPAWVGMGLIVDDQVNALQSYPEQFEVTSAWFEARLAERNINVLNWFVDDFTSAIVEGGFVNSYPSSFHVLGSHPGAYVYVDNGSFNIGVHRDGTMINNNVFRTFEEEFWNVGMWGVWADDIAFSLCANGASAGSVEPSCGS